MLTTNEKERYDRQIILGELGQAGQVKLKAAKVFVAGAGGLGSSVLTYLAAAGVGCIRIVDNDRVSLSNLNRQILHWDKNIGQTKVASARDKLCQLNPQITIEAIDAKITYMNISSLTAGYDLIVDALDNPETRYLLNKTALAQGIPFFHGAVNGFEGRAMTIIPGQTACLRCLSRGTGSEAKFPVIGVTPAVIGSIQAAEVIKYIVGIGKLLTDRLLLYDGINMTFTEFKISRNPHCDHCALYGSD